MEAKNWLTHKALVSVTVSSVCVCVCVCVCVILSVHCITSQSSIMDVLYTSTSDRS